MLEGILPFESSVVRVGGRSKSVALKQKNPNPTLTLTPEQPNPNPNPKPTSNPKGGAQGEEPAAVTRSEARPPHGPDQERAAQPERRDTPRQGQG